MLSGYRTRAYPTAAQAAVLRMWVGHQRFIYNAKVREAEYWRAFARQSLSLTGQAPLPDQAYSQFVGEDTAFLRDVPSQVLRNGAYRFATGCARSLKGLGGAPVIRKKHGRQSVLLTSELFRFAEVLDPATGELRQQLHLGTKSKNLGRLQFKAKKGAPFTAPKMLTVSIEPDGRWYVSFCYEKQPAPGEQPQVLRTEQELAYELGIRSADELEQLVVGIDRGVQLPVATSEGQAFVIEPTCTARIAKKDRRTKRYQRRMARQQLGSKNRAKTRQRIARLKAYGAEVRRDFAHKTSLQLVQSKAQVFAFEDLKLKNMTAAPAPKPAGDFHKTGRYTANGAAAKAGLNRALLGSALGLVKQYTAYKAARRNKLVLSVPAHHSSQQCAECGHTAAENRLSQAEFRCVACGHADNADHNAARVLQQRAIQALREGVPAKKPKKTARVRGKDKVGPVRPEPSESSKPVESVSAVGRSQAANDAVLYEAGNRHLDAQASGGR